jgi:hypothetical protein
MRYLNLNEIRMKGNRYEEKQRPESLPAPVRCRAGHRMRCHGGSGLIGTMGMSYIKFHIMMSCAATELSPTVGTSIGFPCRKGKRLSSRSYSAGSRNMSILFLIYQDIKDSGATTRLCHGKSDSKHMPTSIKNALQSAWFVRPGYPEAPRNTVCNTNLCTLLYFTFHSALFIFCPLPKYFPLALSGGFLPIIFSRLLNPVCGTLCSPV